MHLNMPSILIKLRVLFAMSYFSKSCEISHILLTGLVYTQQLLYNNHMFIIVWLCASVHSASFDSAVASKNQLLTVLITEQQKLFNVQNSFSLARGLFPCHNCKARESL